MWDMQLPGFHLHGSIPCIASRLSTTHQGWKTNERPLLSMPAEWNTTSKYVDNTQVPGKYLSEALA